MPRRHRRLRARAEPLLSGRRRARGRLPDRATTTSSRSATLDVADFNDEAAAAALWTRAALDERSRAFLSALEPSARRRRRRAVPREPARPGLGVRAQRRDRVREPRSTATAPLVLVGHSHVALAIGLDDSELHGGLAPAGTEVDLDGPLAAQSRLGRPAARRRPARRVARARHRREVCPLPPRCISDRAHAGGDPRARASGAAGGAPGERNLETGGRTKWQS